MSSFVSTFDTYGRDPEPPPDRRRGPHRAPRRDHLRQVLERPHRQARHHAQARASRLVVSLWHALVAAVEHIARARRLSQMQATLARLDEATLRDIGLQRSQARAYWAQAEGQLPPTCPSVVVRRPYVATPPS